jgi:hypothetical protein
MHLSTIFALVILEFSEKAFKFPAKKYETSRMTRAKIVDKCMQKGVAYFDVS